jgi:serine-type D-Ala-D-Ala carboxypeptidase (penicillin-binding protein 5/6)
VTHRAARALLALVLLLGTVAPAPPAAVAAVAAVAPAVPGATTGPPPAPVRVPTVRAKAFVLADAVTGQVLLARNADQARPMASTTKVMTGLLAIERLDQHRIVTIGPGPAAVGEESLRLRVGERLTVRQLLEGLLLKSANDAAVALAEAVDGNEAAFVRRMNARARQLGMTRTRYVTSYGLDRPGHATSAADLARLWNVAMRTPTFRALTGMRAATIPGPAAYRHFEHTNKLLGSYPWVLGGKTGFTDGAGRCLVVSARRGGRTLVAVALGSPDAFPDVRALLEYGFTGLVRARLALVGQTVEVTAASGPPVRYRFEQTVDALVPRDQLAKVRLTVRPGAPPAGALVAGTQVLARPKLTLADTGEPGQLRPAGLPVGAVPAVIDRFLAAGAD